MSDDDRVRRFLSVVQDDPFAPLIWIPEGGGEIVIQAGRAEALATLRHVDGRWTLECQPEHLDEAARAFFDAVNLLGDGLTPGGLPQALDRVAELEVLLIQAEDYAREAGAERDEAEAQVARVRALAEEWSAADDPVTDWDAGYDHGRTSAARDVLKALDGEAP